MTMIYSGINDLSRKCWYKTEYTGYLGTLGASPRDCLSHVVPTVGGSCGRHADDLHMPVNLSSIVLVIWATMHPQKAPNRFQDQAGRDPPFILVIGFRWTCMRRLGVSESPDRCVLRGPSQQA